MAFNNSWLSTNILSEKLNSFSHSQVNFASPKMLVFPGKHHWWQCILQFKVSGRTLVLHSYILGSKWRLRLSCITVHKTEQMTSNASNCWSCWSPRAGNLQLWPLKAQHHRDFQKDSIRNDLPWLQSRRATSDSGCQDLDFSSGTSLPSRLSTYWILKTPDPRRAPVW